jgi:hypothetical protein
MGARVDIVPAATSRGAGVIVRVTDNGVCGPMVCTPDEARLVAANLLAAADRAEVAYAEAAAARRRLVVGEGVCS